MESRQEPHPVYSEASQNDDDNSRVHSMPHVPDVSVDPPRSSILRDVVNQIVTLLFTSPFLDLAFYGFPLVVKLKSIMKEGCLIWRRDIDRWALPVSVPLDSSNFVMQQRPVTLEAIGNESDGHQSDDDVVMGGEPPSYDDAVMGGEPPSYASLFPRSGRQDENPVEPGKRDAHIFQLQ